MLEKLILHLFTSKVKYYELLMENKSTSFAEDYVISQSEKNEKVICSDYDFPFVTNPGYLLTL